MPAAEVGFSLKHPFSRQPSGRHFEGEATKLLVTRRDRSVAELHAHRALQALVERRRVLAIPADVDLARFCTSRSRESNGLTAD